MRTGPPVAVVLLGAALGCGGSGDVTNPTTGPSPRTYFMGFSALPPRFDPALVPRTIDLWAPHADAGLVLIEPPWAALLAGVDAETKQRRYIERHASILDAARALGLFQISFTDLDVSAIGAPGDSPLPLFAFLGLVDVSFAPKPALAAWDVVYRRPLRP